MIGGIGKGGEEETNRSGISGRRRREKGRGRKEKGGKRRRGGKEIGEIGR